MHDCVRVTEAHVEVRSQLVGVDFLYHVSFGVCLGSKCFTLNLLMGPGM